MPRWTCSTLAAINGKGRSVTRVIVSPHDRLEFLGDSVLQLVVSRYLFNRFPEYFEGQLSVSLFLVREARD